MSDMVEVKKLTKKFGDLVAVDNVSFSVKTGEIFAFLGPNGVGKSTTIKILTTLLHPTSGSAKINGFDILKQKSEIRKSFGIVFQDTSLDTELTAYENMDFHAALYNTQKDIRKDRIYDLLKFVGLFEKKDIIVKTFSGGMKRRLEIARGLIHHPKILFLDEPTLGLDAQTRNHLWEYIKKLNKEEGMTVFLTTHYLDEAEKIAEKIAIIDYGKIVAIGTVAELKKKTKTKSLEAAYLKFTGTKIREEEASSLDHLRNTVRR